MTQTGIADDIVQEISIQAPADRVFDALTDPAQLVRWWGDGERFKTTHAEIDLRAGGAWIMQGAGMGGRPFTVKGRYREVTRPRLLVFTWLPDWQGDATESVVRIELTETRGVTTVRLTHSGLVTDASRASHRGWPYILGWLKAHVE